MYIPVKIVHISVLLLPQSLQLNLFHRIVARASCSFVPSANSHRCNVVVGAVRRCVRFFHFHHSFNPVLVHPRASKMGILPSWPILFYEVGEAMDFWPHAKDADGFPPPFVPAADNCTEKDFQQLPFGVVVHL